MVETSDIVNDYSGIYSEYKFNNNSENFLPTIMAKPFQPGLFDNSKFDLFLNDSDKFNPAGYLNLDAGKLK